MCITPQGKKKENSVHTTRACRGSVILPEAGTNVCSRAHLAFLLKLDAARSAVSKERHSDVERILVMMCAIMGTFELVSKQCASSESLLCFRRHYCFAGYGGEG